MIRSPGIASPRMALVLSVLAMAASSPTAAESRVPENIIVEQSKIIERFSPPPVKGSASLRVPTLDERIPLELAEQQSFVLRNLRIEGATQLPDEAFRPLWQDMIGREVPVAALFELADRIDRRYLDNGLLAMAVVPLQDLADGDVRIVVFDQSYIRSVEVRGDGPDLRARLGPYIGQLVAMQPLRIRRIERVLLLMSDIAGMNIEAKLSRPAEPGNGGSLVLQIDFEERVTRLALDNRGTDEIGPVQAFATHQENDLLGLFESTTLTGVTIPNQPRELLFGQLAQDFPLGAGGLHVGYRVDVASSRPGGELDSLDLKVTSYTGEVYASYPVLRTIAHSAWVRGSLRALRTELEVGGDSQSRDRYRWLAAGVESEHDVGFGGLALRAALLQGIDAFDATAEGSSLASRGAAEPDFQAATAGAEVSFALSERVSVLAQAGGQYGFGPLPSDVQMAFGGEPFGRGFDSGAASGDSGLMGALELAVDTKLSLDVVRSSAAYGFVDYGMLWFRSHDAADSRVTLGSAGIGFRAFLDGGFAVDTMLAVPVDDDEDVDDPGTRLFLSLKKRF